jgi:VanZ family protein
MNYTGDYFLILATASGSSKRMKYSKLIFWLFATIIIVQAIAPINSANSKLNHTFIFSIRLDYLAHVAMFLCLAVLFRLAYFSQPGFIFSREIFYFGVMLCTAVFSEAIQRLVPYRVFNINDLLANLLGVILSIPLARRSRYFIKKDRKCLESGLKQVS